MWQCKADILRLEFLWHHGGLYVDAASQTEVAPVLCALARTVVSEDMISVEQPLSCKATQRRNAARFAGTAVCEEKPGPHP